MFKLKDRTPTITCNSKTKFLGETSWYLAGFYRFFAVFGSSYFTYVHEKNRYFAKTTKNQQKTATLKNVLLLQEKVFVNARQLVIINNPVGQTHSPGSSDHYFKLTLTLFYEILKSLDGRHGWKLWSLPAATVGRPDGSIILTWRIMERMMRLSMRV